MRAIQIIGPGGPEMLKLTDLPAPEPAAGQVAVATTMIGVNFTDLFARIMAEDGPSVPGVEVAGTVTSVGEGVSDLAVGQRVIAAPLYTLGGYAEQVVADATHVLPIPAGVSDAAAAAIALNYGTAYAALHHCARIQPGETVVVHAAAGGVGTAAVQLARLVPDTHLIGAASAAKHDYLRSQGVHETVDYRSGDWEAAIRANHPDGVDLILDGVGESGFARSIGLLRFGGRVIGYGLASIMLDDHSGPGDRGRRRGTGDARTVPHELDGLHRMPPRWPGAPVPPVDHSLADPVRGRRDHPARRPGLPARRGRRRSSLPAPAAQHRQGAPPALARTGTGRRRMSVDYHDARDPRGPA